MKLSEIKQVPVAKLKENELNRRFFDSENADDFNALLNDINERGILVSLIAKQDGTLLAGHRRIRIARHLKLKTVPVQYVLDALTAEEEEELLAKDNLLRRQLSPADRKRIYKKIVKQFDAKVKKLDRMNIPPREIARISGIPVQRIYQDLARERKNYRDDTARNESGESVNMRALRAWNKAISAALNAATLESAATVTELLKQARFMVSKLETMVENRREAS